MQQTEPGGLIVVHWTFSPNLIEALAQEAKRAGLEFVNAPLTAPRSCWEDTLSNGSLLHSNVTVYTSADVYCGYQNRLMQSACSRVNAVVGWTTPNEKLDFYLRGANLTDEEIIQQATPTILTDRVTYERPRTIAVGARYRF